MEWAGFLFLWGSVLLIANSLSYTVDWRPKADLINFEEGSQCYTFWLTPIVQMTIKTKRVRTLSDWFFWLYVTSCPSLLPRLHCANSDFSNDAILEVDTVLQTFQSTLIMRPIMVVNDSRKAIFCKRGSLIDDFCRSCFICTDRNSRNFKSCWICFVLKSVERLHVRMLQKKEMEKEERKENWRKIKWEAKENTE